MKDQSVLKEETELARGVTVGTKLKDGRYKLRSLLGFSNLSSVWLSRDRFTKRVVAVKVSDTSDPELAHIAANEASLLTFLSLAGAGGAPSNHGDYSQAFSLPWQHQLPQQQDPHCHHHHQQQQQQQRQHNWSHPGAHHVVQALDHFWHTSRGSTPHKRLECLVLERLGCSLQSMLKGGTGWDGRSSGEHCSSPGHKHRPHSHSQPHPLHSRPHHQLQQQQPPMHEAQHPLIAATPPATNLPGILPTCTQNPGSNSRSNGAGVLPQDLLPPKLIQPNPLPQSEVKLLAAQLLLALDFLHQHCGMVHRDLKPGNIMAAAGPINTGTDLSPAIPGMGVSMPLHQAGGRQHPLGSSLKQGSSIEQQEQQHGHHLHHHHHQHQHQHQQHQQQVVGQCMGRHPMHWKLIDFGNAVVLGHGAVALHGAGTQHSGDLHIEGGSSVDRPGSNKSQGQSSQASAGGSYAAASQAANASAPKSQPTGLQLPAVMFQSLAYAPPEDCLGIPAAACTQSSTTQSPCHSISVSESYQPGPASQPQHGVPSFAPSSLITLSSKMPLSQSHAHANLLPFSLTPVHSAAHALPPRFQPTVPWAQPANDMWSLGCVLYEASTGLKLMDLPRARLALKEAEGIAAARRKQEQMQMQGLRGLLRFCREPVPAGHMRRDTAPAVCRGPHDEELLLWLMSRAVGGFTPSLLVRATLSPADDYFYAHGGMPLDASTSVTTLLECVSTAAASAKGAKSASLDSRPPPLHDLASQLLSRSTFHRHCQLSKEVAGRGLRAGIPAWSVALPLRERLRVEAAHLDEEEADSLAGFLTPLLSLDPDQRPSTAVALQHPWLQSVQAYIGSYR